LELVVNNDGAKLLRCNAEVNVGEAISIIAGSDEVFFMATNYTN
jgi:hypothetical protein